MFECGTDLKRKIRSTPSTPQATLCFGIRLEKRVFPPSQGSLFDWLVLLGTPTDRSRFNFWRQMSITMSTLGLTKELENVLDGRVLSGIAAFWNLGVIRLPVQGT